jgi:class 3 adenylate cyclase/tetratricopeptide (TPR) repeat protein
LTDPGPIPKRKDLAGERRVVTILFCDVKGSTSMAEQLDPEEWAEIMNVAFDYLTRPVVQYGGTVARLMGDAILAFFGAPTAHEDDPLRAVLAGLDIVSGIQGYREQLRSEYDLDFNVRVGINTGVVVVGEMGSALAGEYTAMGDEVNLAARLEQTAQPGSIQISADTYRLVRPWIEAEPLGEIEVRGKQEQVQVYQVLGRKAAPERARGIPGLASPLIGREAEFAALEEALDRLIEGRGQILALIGEAGLGKSRLIEELKALVSQKADGSVAWIESRGVSFEMARPYGLFQQHLRKVCDLKDDDPPDIVREKAARTFSTLNEDQQAAIMRMVELLFAPHRDAHGDLQLEGEALKREIFDSSLNLWQGLAENNPHVLVFDDLHWSDPVSVELVLHLFQLTDKAPILILCAFRPYRTFPAWGVKTTAETQYPHRYREISLNPLTESDSAQLVDSLLAISDLPPQLRQIVLSKSEGNPFFLEEVVRMLIDQGVIQREPVEAQGVAGVRWVAASNFEEFEIPDNLQALLLARIDRLEGDARRTLQLASVIGRSFLFRVLETIADRIERLEEQLGTLQRVELIREAARHPELEYMFRHELTRDAAYQSILHRKRREYHRRVAEAIEKLYADRLEEEAHLLADHFYLAREFPRSLKYCELAGDRAIRLSAYIEAGTHFDRAIEIARRLEVPSVQLARLYSTRGRVFELLNQFDKALENYKELEALGRERNDRTLELAALHPQAVIHCTPNLRFDPQRGVQLARRALDLAIDLGDPRAEARALWSLMLYENFATGDLHQAVAYGEQGMRIAQEHDLRSELAQIQHDLGRPYMRLGWMEEAWKVYMDSQLFWRETGNKPMLADNLTSLAESLYTFGDHDRALEFAEEGLQINREIHSAWGEAYSMMIIGPIHLERGDLDGCFEFIRKGGELAEKANFVAGIFVSQLVSAWVHASFGDVETAIAAVEPLRSLVEQYLSFKPYQFLIESLTRLYLGSVKEARQYYDMVGSDTNSELIFGPYVYTLDVEIALLQEQYDLALERANGFLEYMGESKIRLMLPDLLNQKARALLGLERRDEAIRTLQDALVEARRQTSRRILWAVLVDLAEIEPDEAAAASHRAEAREVIEYILAHSTNQRLRESFLMLPGVQKAMRD